MTNMKGTSVTYFSSSGGSTFPQKMSKEERERIKWELAETKRREQRRKEEHKEERKEEQD